MPSTTEYEVLAYQAYDPAEANRIGMNGWNPFLGATPDTSGGLAAYTSIKGSDAVIAFRGTDGFLQYSDYVEANIPASLGNFSSQLSAAIKPPRRP